MNFIQDFESYIFESKKDEHLYVDKSQIEGAGKGLYTIVDIDKDEVICIYTGKSLTNKEAEELVKKGKDLYFIKMLDGTIFDSGNARCFAKYANDAEGFGKTKFKNNSKITLDDDEKPCIMATRNIKAGEEIFVGYGKKYWDKYKKTH